MSATTTEKPATIAKKMFDIPPLKLATVEYKIRGTSPILIHAFSQKAKSQMLSKQMGTPSAPRDKKHPFRDFVESLYWLTPMPAFDFNKNTDDLMLEFNLHLDMGNPRFGFPAVGVKASMVTACTSLTGVKKTEARQAFHIDLQYIDIVGRPIMDESTVRIGVSTADLRYRPMFMEWTSVVPVTFNEALMTKDQVANILNTAGFAVGLGDYRPEKDGQYGRYEVVNELVAPYAE